MKKKLCFLPLLVLIVLSGIQAQQITYAPVQKSDPERMNFEIIGRQANNYLIYKEVKGRHRITVYDENMNQLDEVPISILPDRERILDLSFFTAPHDTYLLYQYQQGDIVYLKAAKVEANGNILEEPQLLDTTMIAYKSEGKIYNLINSADNEQLMIYKVNRKDRQLYRITTKLFNAQLAEQAESRFSVPMENKGDYLTGYTLTNDGRMAFVKYNRQSNGNIGQARLITKAADAESYGEQSLNLADLYLDDIKVMSDEKNQRLLLVSLFSNTKRGAISGLYVYGFDRNGGTMAFEKTTLFSDELKKRARERGSIKNAFDDFFINNIIVNTDGSFTVAAEALFNSGGWDRWGYWGSGFGLGWGYWGGFGPGWGWGWGRYGGGWPYSYYSPFFYRSYWWGGWGPGGWGGNYRQFNAGNIALISFDNKGEKTWDKIIQKSQEQSNTDGRLSYQLMFTGDQLQLLMNNAGKIADLERILVDENGNVDKAAPIQAREKRLNFMPRYGRQVGENVMLLPYTYKNYISFAKLTL
ncbi:hypothetical protein GCM10027051_00100 [Niabella terrae]